MHGQGIFDHRIFGNRGVFGSQLPTEHLDPSRPRPIGPVPGQVVQAGGVVQVQGVAPMLDPVSRYARAVMETRAPNFQAGSAYPTGSVVPVTRRVGALLPVSNVDRVVRPIGRAQQVFQGFGNPDGLGGLLGWG